MPIEELCERKVLTATPETSVYLAAKLMKENNIGNVIVVDNKTGSVKPIGIITDRDIATKIVADNVDPTKVCVNDMMTGSLFSLNKNQGVSEALKMMSEKGVRRVPVVDDAGNIVGILTVDDFFMLIANEVAHIAKLISKQSSSAKIF